MAVHNTEITQCIGSMGVFVWCICHVVYISAVMGKGRQCAYKIQTVGKLTVLCISMPIVLALLETIGKCFKMGEV